MPKGKNVIQNDLLACVGEWFNCFELVRKLAENETRQFFRPIDVVYWPVSKINQIISCYFSRYMRKTYRVVSKWKNSQRASTADQWYACFIGKKSLESHLNSCDHRPSIMYKFENQNIQTYFDNVKFMGDLLFSIYFDFEITSGKIVCHFDEDAILYQVSYAFVEAFYPCLNIDKIFVMRSFNHTFEQLIDVGYLSTKWFSSVIA